MPVESIAYRSTLSVANQIQWSTEHPQLPRHCFLGSAVCVVAWHHLHQQCWVSGEQQEAQRGLQADAIGVSPSPLVVTCLSLSSFHLCFLHSFSFPHSRFLLFSNLLFLFFCPWLPVPSSSPASFICPTAHFLPCHTALLSFLLLLLTLYYSATSFSTPAAVAAPCLTLPSTVQKSFSALQQCSSSLPCYKLTYFSLLLCYFSHLSLHPCCPFK